MAHAVEHVQLFGRDATQTQDAALHAEHLFEDRVVRPVRLEDVVFELAQTLVEVVHHGQVVVHDLIDDLIQHEGRAALADDRAGAHALLDHVNGAQRLVMISDDEVAA